MKNKEIGVVYQKFLARQAALASRKTASISRIEWLHHWGWPIAICSLMYALLVIGVHGWRIGFLPRFGQAEILSDVLWTLSVGLLAAGLVATVLFVAPLIFVSFFDGGGDKARLKMTKGQLSLIGFLLYGAIPLYVISNVVLQDIEVKENFLTLVFPMYFVMALSEIRDAWKADESHSLGPTLRQVFIQCKTDFLKAMRSIFSEMVRAFFFGIVLCIVALSSVFFIGKIGGAFLSSIGLFWPSIGFVVVVLVTLSNGINLKWMYLREERLITAVQFANGITTVVLMTLAIPLIIYFSRIGNLTNATAVFDSKFSGVVSKLTKVSDVGQSVATAKVDVVLAFGADVVLAASGTFLVNSTCEFSWFQRSEETHVPASKNDANRVACIVLPRSSVYSIL